MSNFLFALEPPRVAQAAGAADHDAVAVVEQARQPVNQISYTSPEELWFILGVAVVVLIGVVVMNLLVLRNTYRNLQWDGLSLLKAKLWFIPVLIALVCLGLSMQHNLNPPSPPESPSSFVIIETEPAVNEHPLKEGLPEWVHQRTVRILEGDSVQMVLSSRMHTTVKEADEKLLKQVKDALRKQVAARTHMDRPFALPDALIRDKAIKRRVIEVNQIDFGEKIGVQPMYRVHAQVEISEESYEAALPYWKAKELKRRMSLLGVLLAAFLIVVTSAHIYLRTSSHLPGKRLFFSRLSIVLVAAGMILGLALTLDCGHFFNNI